MLPKAGFHMIAISVIVVETMAVIARSMKSGFHMISTIAKVFFFQRSQHDRSDYIETCLYTFNKVRLRRRTYCICAPK